MPIWLDLLIRVAAVVIAFLVLPLIVGVGRLMATRREGLEYRLLRAPSTDGLGAHRLQLLSVILLCTLVALTVPIGAYSALAVQLTGSFRALLILFSAGLVGSVLLALVPLRRVRLASNLVVVAGPSSWPLSWFRSTDRPPMR